MSSKRRGRQGRGKERGDKNEEEVVSIHFDLEIRPPSSLTWITEDASQPFFLNTHLLTPPVVFNPVSKQLYEGS